MQSKFGSPADEFVGVDIGDKINTAIASLSALGGIIIIPPGNYPFTTPIVCTASNISIVGHGRQVTNLLFTGSGAAITFGPGTKYCKLEGFTLDIQGAGSAAQGISLTTTQWINLRELYVIGNRNSGTTQKCIVSDGGASFSAYTSLEHCFVLGGHIGVHFTGLSSGNNANMLIGGAVETNTTDGTGVYVETGDTTSIFGTDINNNLIGVRFGSTGPANSSYSPWVRLEGNITDIQFDVGVTLVKLQTDVTPVVINNSGLGTNWARQPQ